MKVSVSILDANFQNIQKELYSFRNADRIHLDIMDGHYVPNMSFGPHILKKINFPCETETHLMVNNPERFIPLFKDLKTQTISFHIENTGTEKAKKLLQYIQQNQKQKAGIVIDADTDPKSINEDVFLYADQILVMSVKAGFGGQEFQEDSLQKIKYIRQKGFKKEIEVDGGITPEKIIDIKKAGADIVVVGSFVAQAEEEERFHIIENIQSL